MKDTSMKCWQKLIAAIIEVYIATLCAVSLVLHFFHIYAQKQARFLPNHHVNTTTEIQSHNATKATNTTKSQQQAYHSHAPYISSNNDTDNSDRSLISIVVATKNEAGFAGRLIRNLEITTDDKSKVEIIIIDIGSRDNIADVIKGSKGIIPVILVQADKVYANISNNFGRGTMLNHAVEYAHGDIVLFLRADSITPRGYDSAIRRELSVDSNAFFGSFEFGIETAKNSVPISGQRTIEHFMNAKTKLCLLPSFLQGVFLRKSDFIAHKFKDEGIMDELDFFCRLRFICRHEKRTFVLVNQRVICSQKRWDTIGSLKYTFIDCLMNCLYLNLTMKPSSIYDICFDKIPKWTKWLKV